MIAEVFPDKNGNVDNAAGKNIERKEEAGDRTGQHFATPANAASKYYTSVMAN